ncbi:hypothetical protein CHLNCDRAFT_138514 [Chlorella variabilis]|uniref:tRNA pseudouridine synthase n=1 Tax=Chlorella variabilis TaxID=554065 RepID=E1ZUF7_CHLVA|nr:hypothetical protein CHLNCDRAFT_138514 [Chlorella variabilis]EFN50538.1 hypothetical protein CHLNCDRAFT_138514 [Chlorella variabilis]|eukprot:XP_005842670.1 hypothetical protein CHLNCDRAFT_138514 [Chlorella variabilis]
MSPPAGMRHVQAGPASTAAAPAPDSEATPPHRAPGPHRAGKRKVALFVGYSGTGRRGLQMQRSSAPEETIEDVLEEAIFQAGGILPSNRGNLGKVRVFSVQRVSKSWNARRECIRRSYSYFVPASVLGLALDGGKEDQRRLHLLQHASSKKGQVQVAWKFERDDADPIVRRHFRFIEWCRAGTELEVLVPGGQPCIHLSLQGSSFMLHQIRKMVGMAVAVARGNLPLELLEFSLATPARINLPLAPPSTLMLTGALFSPFKRSWSGQAAVAAQWTGEVLQLKEQGVAAQQQFLREAMLPALDSLLASEEWRHWELDLDRLWFDNAEVQEVLEGLDTSSSAFKEGLS